MFLPPAPQIDTSDERVSKRIQQQYMAAAPMGRLGAALAPGEGGLDRLQTFKQRTEQVR